MKNRPSEASLRLNARVAGLAYILIIVIAMLSVSLVDSRLIVGGNNAATTDNIIAHGLLFRAGIASMLAMYAGVLVLSLALYLILRTVSAELALLALLFRSAEAILGGATVLLSFIILLLASGGASSALGPEALHALVGMFVDVRAAALDIVLVFVGVGGSLYCYLFFVSRSIPRWLAAWGVFSYLSMLVLAFVSIVLPEHPAVLESVLYSAGALFELTIGLWLLFKGVNAVQLA
ncbi:MAG TPA: DUF4386 domain-containing protein [bacterium]|nr:DUF4386 domain-containing protein [bacterium]